MTKKLRSKGLEEGKQWWGLTARKREGKGEVDLTGSEYYYYIRVGWGGVFQ